MFQTTLIIDSEYNNYRIDKVCAEKFPKFSRSQWQKYGIFLLGEHRMSLKKKVSTGEVWQISLVEKSDNIHIQPWDFPLKVLAESKTWAVIEKPQEISVHPSQSENSQQTIINALVHQFGANLSDQVDEINGKKIPRPGLVHRLDKVTSGVLLISKNNDSHRFFKENWGQVEKIYYAIAQGKTPPKGRIEGGIMRDVRDRKKMMVADSENAKPAQTIFWREDYNQQKKSVFIASQNFNWTNTPNPSPFVINWISNFG